MGIEAIFAVFALLLLAALFPFFALFTAVAHESFFLLIQDYMPLGSAPSHGPLATPPTKTRESGPWILRPLRHLTGDGVVRFVDISGAVESGLDVGHDVFAANVIEESRPLKQL